MEIADIKKQQDKIITSIDREKKISLNFVEFEHLLDILNKYIDYAIRLQFGHYILDSDNDDRTRRFMCAGKVHFLETFSKNKRSCIRRHS